MRYNIDKDLLERGTRELVKVAVNNHDEIDFYLSDHSKELKERFGVEIK